MAELNRDRELSANDTSDMEQFLSTVKQAGENVKAGIVMSAECAPVKRKKKRTIRSMGCKPKSRKTKSRSARNCRVKNQAPRRRKPAKRKPC